MSYTVDVCPECGEQVIPLNGEVRRGHADKHGIARIFAIRVETFSLEEIRERLEAEAKKLERPNVEGEDFTSATVRRVKAQGIRDGLAAFALTQPDPKEGK